MHSTSMQSPSPMPERLVTFLSHLLKCITLLSSHALNDALEGIHSSFNCNTAASDWKTHVFLNGLSGELSITLGLHIAFFALPPKILLRSTQRKNKQRIPPRSGPKITISRRSEIVFCDEWLHQILSHETCWEHILGVFHPGKKKQEMSSFAFRNQIDSFFW